MMIKLKYGNLSPKAANQLEHSHKGAQRMRRDYINAAVAALAATAVAAISKIFA